MKNMRNIMKHYRQGDVLIFEVSHLNRDKEIKGKTILAYGEVTGHHHKIEEGVGSGCLAYAGLDGTEVTELEVKEAVKLLHEEHDPITIDPGMYRVVIQVEDHIDWETYHRVMD